MRELIKVTYHSPYFGNEGRGVDQKHYPCYFGKMDIDLSGKKTHELELFVHLIKLETLQVSDEANFLNCFSYGAT